MGFSLCVLFVRNKQTKWPRHHKKDISQEGTIMIGTTTMAFCSGKERFERFTSKYSMVKWEFIAKEQCRGQ